MGLALSSISYFLALLVTDMVKNDLSTIFIKAIAVPIEDLIPGYYEN